MGIGEWLADWLWPPLRPLSENEILAASRLSPRDRAELAHVENVAPVRSLPSPRGDEREEGT